MTKKRQSTRQPSSSRVPPRSIVVAGAAPDRLIQQEWLLTNGLGGFAMGTALGVLTRRYHGLLIGATKPPVGRVNALAGAVERLVFLDDAGHETGAVDLATFEFEGDRGPVLHPRGHELLTEFEHAPVEGWCEWRFRCGAAAVHKRLHLPRSGRNECVLSYAVHADRPTPLVLQIRPLIALRDFHALEHASDAVRVVAGRNGREASFERGDVALNLASENSTWMSDANWWRRFHLREEAARRQDCIQDLFSPGYFLFKPDGQGQATEIHATLGSPGDERRPVESAADDAAKRTRVFWGHVRAAGCSEDDDVGTSLVAAADDFIVARPSASKPGLTVIAGYPWFGDWGRDTLVSIPGLLLTTGRTDEALGILTGFAGHSRNGIIPNLFDEHTGEAWYNTADASLLFLHACSDWLDRTADAARFRTSLLTPCLEIINAYRRGTETGEGPIAEDPTDHLISAGTPVSQLTWMDARRDGVVFTPRYGKPIEINAMWHSGLLRIADAIRAGDATRSGDLRDLAAACGAAIRNKFWNEAAGCLHDCLTPEQGTSGWSWRPLSEVRPNQIFALSLPHSPLSPRQQKQVLATVERLLLTACGIRTLPAGDPNYQPHYAGSLFERDRAYHNGTAWPWLLGPYADAVIRVAGLGPASREKLRAIIRQLLAASRRACLGQIAEVFDGEPTKDAPGGLSAQRAGGCVAQAWSVAECLRIWMRISDRN